ncbi:hypothetical protein CsSME_00017634 [Camellia sinensis var. sinensis]
MQVNGDGYYAGIGMDFGGCCGLLKIKLNIKLILLDCLTQWWDDRSYAVMGCWWLLISNLVLWLLWAVCGLVYALLICGFCSVGSASVEVLVAVSSIYQCSVNLPRPNLGCFGCAVVVEICSLLDVHWSA